MKSIIQSLVTLLFVVLAAACGSNAGNGATEECPSTSCDPAHQGRVTICHSQTDDEAIVCCGGNWVAGTTCNTAPAPVTPAPTPPTPGITQTPGPSPTQPIKDGEDTWCGKSFRTIRIVWAGIPANGYTARRGAWASPVIKNATGIKNDFRAWPSQKPGEYLDTWLEMDRNVTYSTATFEEDAKICSGHSLMVSLYDNHTDGKPAYSPATNCDATTKFIENGVQVTPRCVPNNAADGWNYIVD